MFACFGLRARHKRLSPAVSEVEYGHAALIESTLNGTGSLGRAPLLQKDLSINDNKPHGTPLPARGSFRRKKRRSSESEKQGKHPVKVLRSSASPNVQSRTSVTPSSEQLKKLEAELSVRNRDLKAAEEDAVKANRGVEALTVLLHHLVKEYDAFATPRLKAEIDNLCTRLTNVQLSLDETTATARRLEDEATDREEKHAEEIKTLEENHRLDVAAVTEEHRRKTQETLEKHQLELREAIAKEETKYEELIESHKAALERIDYEWRAQLDKQHERHMQALEQLNSCHTQQLKEAEITWETREKELQEANCNLLKEQNTLKEETKKLEATLLSDKDHRLQAAKRLCTALQNEVDSLKTVVEMRNSEVHKLRDSLTDKDQLTEDFEAAKDRVRSLQAKAEDLHAQMDKKCKLERQLLADQHALAESLQRESCLNKRLSLENEELQWKLRQREAAFAGTLPTATLDLVTRCSPGITPRQEDGCKSGGSSPQITPRSLRNGPSKSQSLRNESDKRWTQSFSNVSEEACKLFRSDLKHDDLSLESPPPSPRVKGVIEKSNSVSFILDLNGTFPEESFLGVPSPPLSRKPRTPNLPRKSLQKSCLEKSSSASYIVGRSAFKETSQKNRNREKGSGQEDSDLRHSVMKERFGERARDTEEASSYHEKCNGSRNTSESSDGRDVEVESPTGVAWTVPVHSKHLSKQYRSSKDIQNRYQLVPQTPPRLLQQPDEDEYEETENEFVEVLTLGEEDFSSAPLTSLFAQTPSTSVSLSDSDVSQCGSRADLTTTEDDCTDDDEGTQRVALPKDDDASQWKPQEGAGEAMIFPDNFRLDQKNGQTLKDSCKTICKSQISSAPSSDSEEPQHSLNGDNGLTASWSEDAECDLTSSSEMHEL